MFLICDQNDIVQDVASEVANLSRGYGFPDYKPYGNVTVGPVFVGDTYKDGVLTPDPNRVQLQAEKQTQERKIAAKARAIAIAECIKDGDLPPDYTES